MTVIINHQNIKERSPSNLQHLVTALRCQMRFPRFPSKKLRCSPGELHVIKPADLCRWHSLLRASVMFPECLGEMSLCVPGCTCLCKWALGGPPIRRSAWAAAQSACTVVLGVPPLPCADDSPSCEWPTLISSSSPEHDSRPSSACPDI